MEGHKTGMWFRKTRAMATAALLLAYPAVSYRTNTARHLDVLGALFAFAPLLLLTLTAAWTGRPRGLWLTLWAAAGLALWHDRAFIAAHYSWAYLAQDVGVLSLLCGLFLRSLRPSCMPLISRLSWLMRGSLTPLLARYTRHVTQLWAGLFGAMAIVSVLLFFGAGVRVWAFYANVLTWPLMTVVFVAEYLVRRVVVPPEERAGFLPVIQATCRHWRRLVAAERNPPRRRLSP
ncbi:hypothetical protein [Acidiferrobacter sp.]|jgi:uncharacterized membrane protein|uniref:COG4648 family protein n=2 Tax=Acidiferrobacter sp. TaxID=1872107 RepID=UPI0026374402|nr:hypothetical protein [Acidiferrobacter sp.]